jgi:hypothetical protein
VRSERKTESTGTYSFKVRIYEVRGFENLPGEARCVPFAVWLLRCVRNG